MFEKKLIPIQTSKQFIRKTQRSISRDAELTWIVLTVRLTALREKPAGQSAARTAPAAADKASEAMAAPLSSSTAGQAPRWSRPIISLDRSVRLAPRGVAHLPAGVKTPRDPRPAGGYMCGS